MAFVGKMGRPSSCTVMHTSALTGCGQRGTWEGCKSDGATRGRGPSTRQVVRACRNRRSSDAPPAVRAWVQDDPTQVVTHCKEGWNQPNGTPTCRTKGARACQKDGCKVSHCLQCVLLVIPTPDGKFAHNHVHRLAPTLNWLPY